MQHSTTMLACWPAAAWVTPSAAVAASVTPSAAGAAEASWPHCFWGFLFFICFIKMSSDAEFTHPSASLRNWLQTDPVWQRFAVASKVKCVCASACVCMPEKREGDCYEQSRPIAIIHLLVKYNQRAVETDICTSCKHLRTPLSPTFPANPVVMVSSGRVLT